MSLDPILSDIDLPIALRKGKRQYTYPISSFVSYDHLSLISYFFIASLDFTSIPKTTYEALSHPGCSDAMMEEINALDDNSSWDLVKLLAGKKAIGCKWVFAVTINLNGSVARFKTHLVVKGCAQTFGVDYFDTFSLVAKLTFVHLFISMTTIYN